MIAGLALGGALLAVPDLSGCWRLDVSRSAYEQSAGPLGETQKIEQNPSQVRFHIVATTRDVTDAYALTLPTDGSVVAGAGDQRVDPSHILRAVSARWDGPALELRERIEGDEGTFEVVARYALSEDGRILSMGVSTADGRPIRTLLFDRCVSGDMR